MIAGLPATDCGSSCPQSSGDAEGSSRPSENSCLRGAETPKLSQAGGASRQQSPAVPHDPAAIAASFNPNLDSSQKQPALGAPRRATSTMLRVSRKQLLGPAPALPRRANGGAAVPQ